MRSSSLIIKLGFITTFLLLAISCTQDLPDVPEYKKVEFCKFASKCERIYDEDDKQFCSEHGEIVEGKGGCYEPSSSSVVPSSSSSSSELSSSSSSDEPDSSSSSDEPDLSSSSDEPDSSSSSDD